LSAPFGPVLEAGDVLKVLKNEPDAPRDLKEKSIFLAGSLIDFSGRFKGRDGTRLARKILESSSSRSSPRIRKSCHGISENSCVRSNYLVIYLRKLEF